MKEKEKHQETEIRKKFSSTGYLRNILLFIPFLAIAGVFWLIIALDDDLQNEYSVSVELVNVPDSVMFITDPPTSIRVNVRDRGTRMVSRVLYDDPVLKLDFSRLGRNGVFRVSAATLQSYMRNVFGGSAQILSLSPDSIYAEYTVSAAKEVPVVVVSDIKPAIGQTVGGEITVQPTKVKVYSRSVVLDTIQNVFTTNIVRRDVSSPLTFNVGLKQIPGCRIVPNQVTVHVPVEPLETRSDIVEVMPINVPVTESLMVFPATVKVNYLVPYSAPDVSEKEFTVVVDYNDIEDNKKHVVPLILKSAPARVLNAELEVDSVEYTIIHR